ncbi:MAG: transcription factor TFIIB [Nitrosopumilus sp.]|nr:transcription factor TFIIB [Nitrosopumilus sp.]NNL36990.1 transcription factor TFIIB [Nitrosopumilus sp.]NNM36000.1 transcription factor TFIIB [Nitrosopumilus sp.]
MNAELVHQKSCKKNLIVTDGYTGEIACSNCGAVSSEKAIDSSLEVTGFSSEDYQNNSRVGMKTSLKMADRGLSTIMESQDRDSTGKSLSKENRRMFYRLRMWDRNSRSAISVKSFQKAFTLLDGISSKLGLPESVVEETAYLFRKIAAKRILAGRSTTSMLCATVYITCRLTDTPRTLQDVANAGNIKKKNLQRIYRFIVKELDLHPDAYNPNEFVTRVAKAVGLSEKTERLAFKILGLASKKNVSTSKNPMAMAAAAINLAAVMNEEKITQIKISDASGISAVTIRDRTKEIKQKIGGEING